MSSSSPAGGPGEVPGDRSGSPIDLHLAGVSFDATGTLFSCPALGAIYSSVLTRHGLAMDEAEAVLAFRDAWQEFECRSDPRSDRWARHSQGAKGWWGDLIRRACALSGKGEPSEFAVAELFHRFTQADAWVVYPEVAQVLNELELLQVPIVVTSNWDSRLHEVLTNLELRSQFVGVVCSHEVGSAKPNAAMFEAARSLLKSHSPNPTGRYVHVGDHPLNDVEGAEAHGFEGVFLQREGEGDIETLADLLGWMGTHRDTPKSQ